MKKLLLSVFLILLIVGIGFLLTVFVIGEPVDGSSIICDVTEEENQVNLYVTTPASAIAFTDSVGLHQEGTTLYITLRKVLVCPLFSSESKHIRIEKMDLTEIYLGKKPVWTAKEPAH